MFYNKPQWLIKTKASFNLKRQGWHVCSVLWDLLSAGRPTAERNVFLCIFGSVAWAEDALGNNPDQGVPYRANSKQEGENQLRGGDEQSIISSQSGFAAGCRVKTLLCPKSDKIRPISKSARESWLEKKSRLKDSDFHVWSEADQSFRGWGMSVCAPGWQWPLPVSPHHLVSGASLALYPFNLRDRGISPPPVTPLTQRDWVVGNVSYLLVLNTGISLYSSVHR